MKPSVIVVTILLLIVAVLHLLRYIFQWQITFNGAEMPQWPSIIACIVITLLAMWLWKENKSKEVRK